MIDPFDVRNALLRSDFAFFLRVAFDEIVGGDPYAHGWHLDAIAHQLDRIRAGEANRLIVTMPPRHLKSFAITTAWVAWMLGNNPALRFICVSYGQDLSDKHARDCLQIMSSSWYGEAFPRTRISRRAIADFETNAGGGRLSTSLGGVLTGRGADIIVIDDPMKADDVLSEPHRVSAKTWFFNTLMSRLNSQETGAIVLVMQRLHSADLAGELLDIGGWDELRLPAIATEDAQIAIGRGRFYDRRTGEALHTARQSIEVLERIKASDSRVFAAQYQQTPVPDQGNFVDPAWFRYYDTPPVGGLVVQSWDTASKDGVGNDFSVGITAIRYQGRYYIIDVHRERMDFVKLRQVVDRLCRQYGVERLLIEDAASGMQLIQMLRSQPSHGPLPIACRPEQDKVTRFSAQASRIEAGEVVLPRTAPWLADFIAELIGFPSTRHDDQADALAQMLRHPPPEYDSSPVGAEEISATDEWDDDDFDEDPTDDEAVLY
jgi:predicted phage terminase large subunit-like protein